MVDKPRRPRNAKPRAARPERVDAAGDGGDNGSDPAYRALLDAMGEGAALITRDGVISYHNSRFAELTVGSSAMPLRGRALRDLVPADAAVSIDGMLERAERGPARIEVSLLLPDGGALTLQVTASTVSAADIHVLCVVASDLSEQRVQAEQYREALVGIETRERLISVAAHELRAPIQVLVAEIAVLLAEPSATTAEQLESIQRLGLQLADLVGALLDVRLLGSDHLELSIEQLDLADIVRTAIARSQDLVRSGSAVTLEARSVRGSWDRLRLEQVVTNLLSNAGKYGLGRPIRVVIEGDEAAARLVVEDHGIGIAREAIERLFRPFERINSVKTATGLGLGLYITAQIVKAHGGVVRAESDPGVGSRFVVELPYG